MKSMMHAAVAFCFISTAACAAVAPYAKFEEGMLSTTLRLAVFPDLTAK